MIAPSAAPPPVTTAVRLPFPFSARNTDDVSMACVLPFTVIEVKVMSSEAPPLNLPSGLASTTVPATAAPAGITTAPPTSIGFARVALKV